MKFTGLWLRASRCPVHLMPPPLVIGLILIYEAAMNYEYERQKKRIKRAGVVIV